MFTVLIFGLPQLGERIESELKEHVSLAVRMTYSVAIGSIDIKNESNVGVAVHIVSNSPKGEETGNIFILFPNFYNLKDGTPLTGLSRTRCASDLCHAIKAYCPNGNFEIVCNIPEFNPGWGYCTSSMILEPKGGEETSDEEPTTVPAEKMVPVVRALSERPAKVLRVAIIDNNKKSVRMISECLRLRGHEPILLPSLSAGLPDIIEYLRSYQPSHILLDGDIRQKYTGQDIAAEIEKARSTNFNPVVVSISGQQVAYAPFRFAFKDAIGADRKLREEFFLLLESNKAKDIL
jgi:hypothetical protein